MRLGIGYLVEKGMADPWIVQLLRCMDALNLNLPEALWLVGMCKTG